MAYFKTLFIFLFVITSCKTEHKQTSKISNTIEATNGFVIAFGSCNNQVLPNTFWPEIKKIILMFGFGGVTSFIQTPKIWLI